tara:strand:+ start:1560 stop:1802 length:243 start_codon:yes stop_codon:yes gene_type:complete
MIDITAIRDLIDEAKADYVMGIVKNALPADPSASELSEAIKDLVKPENQTASGTCLQTGARDFTYENEDYILEIEYPATL